MCVVNALLIETGFVLTGIGIYDSHKLALVFGLGAIALLCLSVHNNPQGTDS